MTAATYDFISVPNRTITITNTVFSWPGLYSFDDSSVPVLKFNCRPPKVPMVVTKIDRDTLRLVSTPMGSSITYNPSTVKPKKQAKNPTKRRRKAGGTGSGEGSSQILVPEEKLHAQVVGDEIHLGDAAQEENDDDDDMEGLDQDNVHSMWKSNVFDSDEVAPPPDAKKREMTFLDDMLAVFTHVVHSQREWLCRPIYEKPLMQIRAIVISVGLEFCFAGSVHVNGKPFKTWSSLRTELKDLIIKALSGMKTVSPGSDAKQSTSADAAATAAASKAVAATAAAKGVSSTAIEEQGVMMT